MSHSSATDERFMSSAIELALAAKGTTFPNPAVGALIVKAGRTIGLGATREAGGPHAEVVALAQAAARARDATLYVTLEPCCHHGRTPPCTEAIIAAGIKRVVVAVSDPNPRVNGKGIRRLRRAGIAVTTGVLGNEAAAVNEDFFWAIRSQSAWVTLKLACTLDGRIADHKGDSRWITGSDARVYVHELRRRHAAVAVGRSTLEQDDPRLTVRHRVGFFPARIVFTSDSRLPRESFFARHAHEARSIVVLPGDKRGIRRDAQSGLEYWHTGEREGRDHLAAFRSMAFENDLTSVFVEGGSMLASGFLEHGQVNRLHLFYGNKLLGAGREGISFANGLPIERCITLRDRDVRVFEESVLISGTLRWRR